MYFSNILQTYCVAIVHVKLMSGYNKCKYVKTCSNPTIVCILKKKNESLLVFSNCTHHNNEE